MDFEAFAEYLKNMNFISLCVRMLSAVLLGGIIGIGRERKNRSAGLRTYILVCLGAATSMMLSEYIYTMSKMSWAGVTGPLGLSPDISRIGAQVVAGIGFLGAGTILLTRHKDIKGVTTAAGLWASGCMGLAIGAGFYECVSIGFVLILLCFRLFPLIEDSMVERSRSMNIYTEFDSLLKLPAITDAVRSLGIEVYEVEFDPEHEGGNGGKRFSALLYLGLSKGMRHSKVMASLSEIHDILVLEEL